MFQVISAFILDLIIGDPKQIPHPVVIMGKLIDFLELHLRRIVKTGAGLKAAGVVLMLITVGVSYGVTFGLVEAARWVNNWFGMAVSVFLLSTTIAVKGLSQAAMEIYLLLDSGNLDEARKKVGWIVGRDTANLDEGEITRATVETVAENLVDGIIAPLFYGFIGGVPLAMAYKAVNTLDSMVGYKNDKYRDLGWASARFDDLCNYIPARISGVLLMVSFIVTGKPVGRALRSVIRDAGKHPSPNGGIPESAVAGALGIRLGGVNFYGGVESFRAYMGEQLFKLEKNHIRETVKIMYVTSVLAVLIGTGVRFAAG